MIKLHANANQRHSRLVIALSSLGVSGSATSHSQFIRKMAELFDLSYSVTFSTLLRQLQRFEQRDSGAADGLRETLLTLRQQQVDFIRLAFQIDHSDSVQEYRIPKAVPLSLESIDEALKPLQRYYTLLQSELEYQLHKVRLKLRQTLSAVSHRGAQLAALDASLDKMLSADSRKLLATLPLHLKPTLVGLLRDRSDASEVPVDDWLPPMAQSMQQLMLAELDTRMQPLLGLLEALEEELEHTL